MSKLVNDTQSDNTISPNQQSENLIEAQQPKILIIDDNVDLSIIMSSYLKKNGCVVETADNGFSGLEKYISAQGNFDVVFLDIQMPEMDGYETSRRIAEYCEIAKSQIPSIIAISGDEINNNDHIFNYTINKPFQLETIVPIIENVLRENK